ncbi:MAG: putative zinc-finger [Candidatus Acidoferrum typicum]|nr:putative zinc-finger [Candidatus Acidoferrum typicum]
MSCSRMEKQMLPYVDGRLKVSEQREVEVHLAACPACQLRVNEFRAVSGLLDELPQIEPSGAFDARVRARVAAEPVKQSWWAVFAPSPRAALAASMLLLATIWIGSRPTPTTPGNSQNVAVYPGNIDPNDLPVLENYDILANFEPLTDLPQPVQGDDSDEVDGNQAM